MPNPVRAHRAPVRYSLKTFETRRIARLAESHGGLTRSQVRGLARRYGCATKPILRILESRSLAIKPEPAPESRTRTTPAPPDRMTRKTWRENVIRAEALFQPPPGPSEAEDRDDPDTGTRPACDPSEAETTALAMIDELAAERAAIEDRETKADQAIARARGEIVRVAKLRRETAAERDAAAAALAERDRLAETVRRLESSLDEVRARDARSLAWRIRRAQLSELRPLVEDLIAEIARRMGGGRALRK